MQLRKWMTRGSIVLGALGVGLAVKSFLPQRFATESWPEIENHTVSPPLDTSALPEVDITILRCGSITIPEWIAVRGAPSFAPCVISYSCVLVRHPKATFLYDTGFCTDIRSYLVNQSLLFRRVLAKFCARTVLNKTP